jgi:hypothetical protein
LRHHRWRTGSAQNQCDGSGDMGLRQCHGSVSFLT